MPHAAVIRSIDEEGGSMDLATTGEVQLVERLGIAPARCIPPIQSNVSAHPHAVESVSVHLLPTTR